MSIQQSSPVQEITINNTTVEYRLLNPSSPNTPLVMVNHFRSTIHLWDPLLINTLAVNRPILLIQNFSTDISSSTRNVATTMHGWASHILSVIQALKFRQIDLLGFSMGGGVVQTVSLLSPGLVKKLIIAGSRTSRTPNTTAGPRHIFEALRTGETEEEFRASVELSFYNPNTVGKKAAAASWARMLEAFEASGEDRKKLFLSVEEGGNQVLAFTDFDVQEDSVFKRIRELTMPVLVANGDNDLLVSTSNSVELKELLPNAQLIVYPDSGHGFLSQYAEVFARDLELFLDGKGEEKMSMRAKLT